MDIQTRKIEFVQAFLKLENEALITSLEELLQKGEQEKKPMSLEKFNRRIDRALLDSANDNVTENANLINEIEQWS